MDDDAQYQAKFNEMQKYLPFLQKVIEKLRINNEQLADNPRKGQLQKMEMLHDLLTNKAKKLRIDTLLKCEGVLIKLHTKMDKSPFLQSDNETSNMTSTSNIQQQKQIPAKRNQIEIVDITGPASPPPQQMEEIIPVEIPTERRCSPIITNELTKQHKNPQSNIYDKRSNDRQRSQNHQQQYKHHNNNNNRNRSFERPDNSRNKSRDQSGSRWDTSATNTSTATLGSNQIQNNAAGSSSSNGTFQRDRNLSSHRNTDSNRSTPTLKQQQNSWDKRSSDTHSNQRRSNTADKNDAYSPEESWDEIAKPRVKTPVIDIIDLLDHSPTNDESEVVQTFHETIFKYKKPEGVGVAVATSKTGAQVFARLGAKVKAAETSPSPSMSANNYENFKIKVSNEHAATLQRTSSTGNKLSPSKAVPISIPVKVPTIPEVLKSPPLSASDISNLLYESMDISLKASQGISVVGTRRPPKSNEQTSSSTSTATEPASLDMVRKKLAMITKNSPQFCESPASPMSSQNSRASPVQRPPEIPPSERLALKYNPHRRTESVSSSECGNSPSTSSTLKPPTDPRLSKQTSPLPNFNVLPSINLQDPRLRRTASSLAMNSIPQQVLPHQVQQTQSSVSISQGAHLRHFQPHVNAPVGPPVFPPRNDPRYSRGTSRPPEFSNNNNYNHRKEGNESSNHNDPRMRGRAYTPIRSTTPGRSTPPVRSRTPGRQFVDNNNKYQKPSSSNKSGPTKSLPLNKQIPNFNKNLSTHNQKAATNYSSEENWDTDPETPAPAKDISYSEQTISPTNSPKFTSTSRTIPASSRSIPPPKPTTQTSSEENWDSEPETSATTTKTSGPKHTVNQAVRPIWATQTSKPTQNSKPAQAAKLLSNVSIPTNIVQNSSPRDPNSWSTQPNNTTKPWISVMPKTTYTKESNKTSEKPTIISNIAIASPITTTPIPMLQTYATHHISQKPNWNADNFNKSSTSTKQHKIRTADNRMHSPVDKWDKNTDSSPVIKSTAAVPQMSKLKSIPPNAERNESPVPNAKFSALLNDKSERIKYFESKKQKFAPPRTYGEFKQAKARAAAEEAAKRVTLEVDKVADEAVPKPTDETETPAVVLSKPAPVSTLDILYRNSNFSTCELPKTNTGFKIPKKQAASKKEMNVEVNSKESNNVTPNENSEETTKSNMKVNDEKVDATDKQDLKISKDSKTKREQKVEPKKQFSESNEKNDSINKAKVKKNVASKNKKLDATTEETTSKSATVEKIKSIFNAKKGNKITDTLKEQLENISKSVDPRTKGRKSTNNKNNETSTEEVEKSKSNDESHFIDTIVPVADDFSAHNSEQKVINEVITTPSQEEVPAEKQQESDPSTQTTTVPVKLDVALPKTTNQLPQRILKRRCTMIAFGSASEVDKEKIHSANAMLFEDLQHQQKKLAQKTEEEAKQLGRRNKYLSDMFQKTDDNCTVSTQNIITGKRRTRATVNLNEVAFGLSVFKHMKTHTPKKEAIETTITAVESPKVTAAATKKTKKSPLKKGATAATKDAILAAAKKKDDASAENANERGSEDCAILSPSHFEDINAKVAPKTKNAAAKRKSNVAAIALVESVDDNESSSSAKISTTTSSYLADNTEEPNISVEDIIAELAKPEKREYYLSKLRQIFSDDKMILIEAYAEGKKDADGENDEPLDKHVEEDVERNTKPVTKPQVQTTRKRKARCNELDRLNADIRDMFICQGVLTANGRRMCTLVAEDKMDSSKAITTASEVVKVDENKLSTSAKEVVLKKLTKANKTTPTSLRMRKAKVVISPLSKRQLRRSTRAANATSNSTEANSEDETEEESVLDDREMGTTTDVTEIEDLTSLTEEVTDVELSDTPPRRRMPVLKPNTPIKLSEEDDASTTDADASLLQPLLAKRRKVEVKLVKININAKPCPKSKKIIQPASTEDLATSALESESEDIDMITEQTIESHSKNSLTNTNPNWHSQTKYAKWCVVCNVKLHHAAMHYKMNHPEHYAARLAPTILQQFKQGKLSKPLFGISSKRMRFWFYRCPFCLQHNRWSVKTWLEHFVTHTGEYNYECSKCHKGGNKPSVIEKHIKKICSGATVIRNTFFCWSLTQSVVNAHVCHLCNFIQLERGNLERHYVQQHSCDKDTVDVLGYSIILLSTEDVEIVSQKKATLLEKAAINEMSNNKLVIDDDEEEDTSNLEDKADQEETECTETVDSTNTIKDSSIHLNKRKKKKMSDSRMVKTGKKTLINSEEANRETNNTMTAQTNSDEVIISGTGKELAKKSTKSHGKNQDKHSLNLHEDVHDVKDQVIALAEQVSTDTEEPPAISESRDEEAMDAQDELLAVPAENSSIDKTPKSSYVTNSNVFMPTRETNDSPTTVIFAQSLLTIEQDADNDVGSSVQRSNTSNCKEKNAISMAERLTQRFKDLTAMAILPKAPASNSEEKLANDQTLESISLNTSASENGNLVIAEENSDLDTSFDDDANVPEKSPKNSNSNSDTEDEDDGNWEDIEITEMAPSTSSSSSVISKDSKTYKRKQIFQKFNRLYANNKYKKTATNGDVKKKRITANTNTEKVNANETFAVAISNIADTSTIGFRPMITNLADLLPDSPCNDPIELVPELAPLEPLQDLNDISSILESNFSALETQNILQQMDMETSNSVCINSDNQQTSIQEALDFVSEQEQQEQQFDALNINKDLQITQQTSSSSTHQVSQAIINRIHNVGYSVSLDQEGINYKYYCLSDHCTFLYSSEAIGLENHYLSEHPQSRWMGYCNACKEQIVVGGETNDYSLSQEIKHMLEKHTAPIALLPPDELTITIERSTTPSPIAEIKEKPRIKLRRLSGDCLSSSTTPNSKTPTDLTATTTITTTTRTTSSMLSENTKLCDLLNAKPRPPTKKMPPQLDIQFTDSLFANNDDVPSASKTASNAVEPLFKNVGNELTIISVASGDPIESSPKKFQNNCTLQEQTPVQAPPLAPITCELQISSVVSLSDTARSDEIQSDQGISDKTKAKSKETSNATTTGTASTTSKKSASCMQLPKISNVCSLSARAGALWAKQIATERVELQESASDSRELSRFLDNSSGPSTPTSHSTSRAGITDSPEPEVVSETVPIAQATSGDFLITQTVSAHYEEGTDAQVGFNISIAATNLSAPVSSNSNSGSTSPVTVRPSLQQPLQHQSSQNVGNKQKNGISASTTPATTNTTPTVARPFYKCLGTGCKYQTRVTVAMGDHLRFHERRNLSTHHEYFRCSHCNHMAEDVDGFIKHAEEEHLAGKSATTNSTSGTVGAVTTTTGMSSASALTQKIQNILKSSAERRNSVSSETTTCVSNTAKTAVAAPVKSYRQQLEDTIKDIVAPTGVPDDKLYRCIIEGCPAPLTESTFHTHLVYHLSTLGIHVNTTTYNYKCPHCTASYIRPAGIKAHIKCHARHRYFCYICMETSSNAGQILKHFSEKHWRTMNMYTANLLPMPTSETAEADVDTPIYYVAYATQISDAEVQQFGEKLIVESARRKAGSKTHFKPSEISLLPIQPIFQKEIACAECAYKTKVRTNMLRHLQGHKAGVAVGATGAVDPVNPVPCLNTNEKHFDKMTNMAASSLPLAPSSSATKPAIKVPYAYVPETKRFTCGVAGCQYLTITDDIFRSHLTALHGNTSSYSCPFCHEEICKRGLSVDRVVQHLRFHGQRLFQCEECEYLHYMKNVVERHINDKHATLRVNLLTHLRVIESGSGRLAEHVTSSSAITGKKFKEPTPKNSEAVAADATTSNNAKTAATDTASTSSTTSSGSKSKHKWSCDLCAYKAAALPQITQHCQTRHGCHQPYQCIHCPFGAQQLSQIMTHIDQQHDGRPREARNIFHKLQQQNGEPEDAADTRPLWQRDDPKRVRHIRGILMENEEESEQYRKRLCLDIDDDDDDAAAAAAADDGDVGNLVIAMDDEAKEKPPRTSSVNKNTVPQTLFLGTYEFGCLYCDFKGSSFGAAQKHWHDEHNAASAGADTAKPFYFRLLKQLKCPECLKFIGGYSELQLHLQNTHKTRVYIAADPDTTRNGVLSCGYCLFSCSRIGQLVKHFQREAHKPQDLKLFSATHFKAVANLGRQQSYLQCTMCAELFANREAIVAHARAKHENEEGFSFKELSSDTPIYRCAICGFSSVTELCTLRHMIDHYGQFKRCHFCKQPQTTFNGYMQHCYSDHREEIRSFSEIYPMREIKKYLLQMFVIFSNGFIINKKNLKQIQPHGSEARIHQLYEEIHKTSQEPPIPRLSIARLVARKSIEASQLSTSITSNANNSNSNSHRSANNEDEPPRLSSSTAAAMQLAGTSGFTAKKISKRRSTVALGSHDNPTQLLKSSFTAPNKKRKISISMAPPPPVTISLFSEDSNSSIASSASCSRANAQQAPYSFYGSRPKVPDLSKIYTKIAIGGLESTSLSIDKFKLLFPIDVNVVLDSREVSNYQARPFSHVRKACPASQKHRFN